MIGNNFDAEAAQQLSRALLHLPALTALYLDDCEIGTEGARHIAGAVKKLSNLQTLSLCTCEITAAGAYVLARYVVFVGFVYCSFALCVLLYTFARCPKFNILTPVVNVDCSFLYHLVLSHSIMYHAGLWPSCPAS
jgi:hypothetical protein